MFVRLDKIHFLKRNLLYTAISVLLISTSALAQAKYVHIYVALCDNVNQGIVPVPSQLGNGKDASNNLYWGAAYGIKSFFRYKTSEWKLIKTISPKDSMIIERLLFKHVSEEVYILADAYDGARIKNCIADFLRASNGQNPVCLSHSSQSLSFGGDADLVAYIGHDGLMEFDVEIEYRDSVNTPKDAIILACYSQDFFSEEIEKAGANPILWTTHLMAPEAYTLKAALDGWMLRETGEEIDERAAQAYHKYQKCGLNGARNLFTTGF